MSAFRIGSAVLLLFGLAAAQRIDLTLSSTVGGDPGPGIPACEEGPGWYTWYDGTKATTEKYWWLPTGQRHGNGGKWWIDAGVLYSAQNGAGQGGALYTRKQFKNMEAKVQAKPGWGNDGGIFFRAMTNNQSYQVVLDYHTGSGSAIGGVWGERNLHSISYKPFGFNSNPSSITLRSEWYLNGTQGREKLTAADWPTKIWKVGEFNWVHAKVYHDDPPWIDTWVNGYQMVHYEDGIIEANNRVGYLALQVHGGSGGWSSSNTPNLYQKILLREIQPDGKPLAAYAEWEKVCNISTAPPLLAQSPPFSLRRGHDRLILSGEGGVPRFVTVGDPAGRVLFQGSFPAGSGAAEIPWRPGSGFLEVRTPTARQAFPLSP